MLLRLIVAPLTLARNVVSLVLWALRRALVALSDRARRRSLTYLMFELPQSFALGPPRSRWRRATRGPERGDLLTLRAQLDQVRRDPKLKGLIVTLDEVSLGLARMGDVIGWIDAARESGKHVIIHADSADLRTLALMSAADDMVMTPAGRIYGFGLRLDELFLGPLLERMGIEAQFIHIGAFKTATHRLHKAGSTPAQALQTKALHDGLMDHLMERVARRTGQTAEQARQALRRSPLEGQRARQLKLLHGQCFKDEVIDWVSRQVAEQAAEPDTAQEADVIALILSSYLRLRRHVTWRPLVRAPRYMAALDLSGTIVHGQGTPTGGEVIDPEDASPALRALREDPRCAGVLVHINSPGGSALASDLLWHELDLLRQAKPVVAYCSDVAASGGYYLAVACDRIICRPESVVGSIGVITGKLSASGLLERLDVRVESVREHDSAAFTSLSEPLSPQVLEQLRQDARAFYHRFLERVGDARRIERGRLHRFARGRVYLGKEAHDRGLVDGLGGLDEAIAQLYTLAKLKEREAPLEAIEHRSQTLRQLVSGALLTASERALLAQAQQQLLEMRLLGQAQVLALMPGLAPR